MTLERDINKSGSITIKMTVCPKCGEEFDHGNQRMHHLMNDHKPSDFNLSELWE